MIGTDSSLQFKVAEVEEVVSNVGECLAGKPLITEMESRTLPKLIATFKATSCSIARLKVGSHVSPTDAFNFLSSESLQ
jgi:3-deoxy-D-manno-octulosonic-acid transferase